MSAEVVWAAYGLLFLKAAEPPPEEASVLRRLKRLDREIAALNDWNGANRVKRGTSGQVTSSAGASTAGGDPRQAHERRR